MKRGESVAGMDTWAATMHGHDARARGTGTMHGHEAQGRGMDA